MKNLFKLTLPAVLLLFTGMAEAEVCGGPLDDNMFGRALDYTSDEDKYAYTGGQRNKLRLVERYHFNRKVETLESGMQGPLPGDIHYTLMQFPNHYRALNSMARWHLQNPNPKEEDCDCLDWLLPAECYFTRAMTLTPEEPMLYYIFGLYLHQKGSDLDQAVNAYNDAAKLGLDTAEFHYNLGLLMVDVKDYESARKHAEKAYAMGVRFPGLQNKLKKLGKW